MESIFGKFYLNRNLSIELSRYFAPEDLLKMLSLSKKTNEIYSQELILWICLSQGFKDIRVVENFIIEQEKGLTAKNIGSIMREMKQYQLSLKAGKGIQVKASNHFLVHVHGMIGFLPKEKDILATSNENFDLLSAFQNHFIFQNGLYELTTYSCPMNKYNQKLLNDVDCFFILGNDNLYYSRKDCEEMISYIEKEKLENVVMIYNSSPQANQDSWKGQMQKEIAQYNGQIPNGVQKLKEFMAYKNMSVLDINIFSHRNVSLIFNHILKSCIKKRRSQGSLAFDIQPQVDEVAEAKETKEKGNCWIF